MRARSRSRHRARAAFTLVELLVALAIGLVVVAALVASYLASAQSGRHAQALVQLSDDGTAALELLRVPLAMAGYAEVQGLEVREGVPHLLQRPGRAIQGCEGGRFADDRATLDAGLACRAVTVGGWQPDAVAVAYDVRSVAGPGGAPRANAMLGSGATPLDCAGNGLPARSDDLGRQVRAEAHFHVESGHLYCQGPGSAGPAPLIDNVDDLQLLYGLAAGPEGGPVAAWAPAPEAGSEDWARVVAVSVCVLLHSPERVLDPAAAASTGRYMDCGQQPRVSDDGRLRRAFSTTVLLQNGPGR